MRLVKPSGAFEGPSRFLYVCGLGEDLNSTESEVIDIFKSFGELDTPAVFLQPGKRFCFVVYKESQSAQQAKETLTMLSNETDLLRTGANSKKLMIKYAVEENEPLKPPEPEESVSADLASSLVPGLSYIANFISEEEEKQLLDGFCGENGSWQETLNRRVQHYGFTFNYRTLHLDYGDDTLPIPSNISPIIQRIELAAGLDQKAMESSHKAYAPLNQLTINEYVSGQGIAAHTDTTTCFGPVMCVLSLGSATTVTYTSASQESDANSQDTAESQLVRSKAHLFVERRSLVIMAGDSRYKFTHGIACRKTDKLNGETIERGKRVSLTFRQAVHPGDISRAVLLAPSVESEHVHQVYDRIALHWHHTRGKRKVHWHSVKAFIESLPAGTLMADVGCGDGKYFGLNPGVICVGCDRSFNLLHMSRLSGPPSEGSVQNSNKVDLTHEAFCCDAVSLPLESERFDAVLCIAVLHHISTVARRVALIRELLRITVTGGSVLVQAWAQEQDIAKEQTPSRKNKNKTGNSDTRTFDFASSDTQDVFVPWTLPTRFALNGTDININANIAKLENEKDRSELPSVKRAPALNKRSVDNKPDEECTEEELKAKQSHALEDKRKARGEEKRKKAIKKRMESSISNDIKENQNDKEERKELDEEIAQDIEVLQRYCHVYKEGELEDLCSSIASCRVAESGHDKGNWFVRLVKVNDSRLEGVETKGSEGTIEEIVPRTKVQFKSNF